jgi:hypothetical protein
MLSLPAAAGLGELIKQKSPSKFLLKGYFVGPLGIELLGIFY